LFAQRIADVGEHSAVPVSGNTEGLEPKCPAPSHLRCEGQGQHRLPAAAATATAAAVPAALRLAVLAVPGPQVRQFAHDFGRRTWLRSLHNRSPGLVRRDTRPPLGQLLQAPRGDPCYASRGYYRNALGGQAPSRGKVERAAENRVDTPVGLTLDPRTQARCQSPA